MHARDLSGPVGGGRVLRDVGVVLLVAWAPAHVVAAALGGLVAWLLLPVGPSWAVTALLVAGAPAAGVWLHESGHAIAARVLAPQGDRRVVVHGIAARIERDALTPRQERVVAASGPLLAGVPGCLAVTVGVLTHRPAFLAGALLALHLCNLLPVTGDGAVVWRGRRATDRTIAPRAA